MNKVSVLIAMSFLSVNSAAILAQPTEEGLTPHARHSSDWPNYSFDYSNSNNNPFEEAISRQTAVVRKNEIRR
jgi:hypothetical protein